jgi:NAD(P)-dependent dehydrogenase (short-subunit alcohol dehydrogenase family)
MEYRASGNLRGLGGLRALVTGGGAGIGQAIADRLTVEDATVLIADRDVDAGQHAAQRLGARFVAADLSTREGVRAMMTAVRPELGGLDVLINNVGGCPADLPGC